MHNYNVEERDRLSSVRKRMKGGKAGDDRSPAESWKACLYISDDTSNVCITSEMLLACLLIGGTKVKVSGKETLKTHSQRIMFDRLDYDLTVQGKRISRANIDSIVGEFTEQSNACRQHGFSLHVKPCTVGASKHIRVRPKFVGWSVAGSFLVEAEDANVLGLNALRELFTVCGRMAGLGDWRPESAKRPGQYGRFSAVARAR